MILLIDALSPDGSFIVARIKHVDLCWLAEQLDMRSLSVRCCELRLRVLESMIYRMTSDL